MLTIEQTKIMAQASLRVYPDVGGAPDGYVSIYTRPDSKTGFYASVFKKNDSNATLAFYDTVKTCRLLSIISLPLFLQQAVA